MPVMGARRGFFFAIAMGTLGAGCGPEQQHQEAAESRSLSRMQQRVSLRWLVTGLQVGTSRDDEFLDVTLNQRGEVFVAGYEDGVTGVTNVEPTGDSRGLLIRYDSTLDDTEELRFDIDRQGTTEVVEALAIHPVSQEVYFAGRTTGSFSSTPNQGQFDNIAGWLDSSGTTHVSQWGTQRPQHPRRIALDAQGNVVVSGYDDIYIPSNYVDSVEDPFVTRLKRGAQGLEPLWTKQFNTTHADLLPGMVLDDSGAIYVTGTNSSGLNRGMFVRKFETGGTDGWAAPARQSTIAFDSAASLALTGPVGSRSLIFAGSSFALLGERQFGDQDVVVRKLSLSGTTLWTHQYGTEGSDWVTDMTTDTYGNIYLVGETTASFDPSNPNEGQSDMFMMKLDANGLNPEVIQLGSPGEEHPTAVTADACGNVYITGYTTASLLGGTHSGGHDAFVMRLTPTDNFCVSASHP